MKRPARARIPINAVDMSKYWTERDDPSPGDSWVCMDGGWHSRPIIKPCDEHCECSVAAREWMDQINKEYESNGKVDL